MMRKFLSLVLVTALVAGIGYTDYIGYEGSRQAVSVDEARSRDCRTPDVLLGWAYEPINYEIADDAALALANPDMANCETQGVAAGEQLVTDDGVHLAGWYVPAANGVGPSGPTVVLVHGYAANKTDILPYAAGLHESFNLVAFDLRNGGRSTGTATTYGVNEQRDLRTVIDWVEREKGSTWIGVLGNSMGAATAITEARTDPRVRALALDSMHTRVELQFEQRLKHSGHPPYPGTWAILVGAWLRSGVDVRGADPLDAIPELHLPLLVTHGTADEEDLPERTEGFIADATAAGLAVESHWCEGAGHGLVIDACTDDYAAWVSTFFTTALAQSGS